MMSILSRKVLVAVVFCAVAVCLCGAFGLYLLLAPEPRAIGYRDSGSVQSTTTLRTGNNQSISFSTAEGLGHGEKTSLMFTQPDQSNVSLTIPEKLGDSATYTLRQSEDQHRLILVTERGVAVWRNAVPHELLHVWDATSEPLAGPKGEYAQNKLMLEFNVSPDGTLACIHAVKQTAFDYRESKDGLVLVRDLETGQDIGNLSFPGEGLVQFKVAWSRDSRRLATYSDDKHEVAVWKLPERGSPVRNPTPSA